MSCGSEQKETPSRVHKCNCLGISWLPSRFLPGSAINEPTDGSNGKNDRQSDDDSRDRVERRGRLLKARVVHSFHGAHVEDLLDLTIAPFMSDVRHFTDGYESAVGDGGRDDKLVELFAGGGMTLEHFKDCSFLNNGKKYFV